MIKISKKTPKKLSNDNSMLMFTGDSQEWEKCLSSLFVELEVELKKPNTTLSSKMYQYPFGDVDFIRSVTEGCEHHVKRTTELINKSEQNNFYIAYVLSGEALITQDKHSSNLRHGDIAILDSSRAYSIDVLKSLDSLWVSVPRHRLEGRLNSITNITAQRIDGSEGIGYVISCLLQAALHEAPRIKTNEANRISNHFLDLISLSLKTPDNVVKEDSGSDYLKSTLRRIQDFIEKRLDDENLTPQSIAKDNAISIRYLSKLFQNEGISTAKWIRMRRLERCRSDIESEENRTRSISEIAYSHGFSNICSFNRAFRQHFKVAPNKLRTKQ